MRMFHFYKRKIPGNEADVDEKRTFFDDTEDKNIHNVYLNVYYWYYRSDLLTDKIKCDNNRKQLVAQRRNTLTIIENFEKLKEKQSECIKNDIKVNESVIKQLSTKKQRQKIQKRNSLNENLSNFSNSENKVVLPALPMQLTNDEIKELPISEKFLSVAKNMLFCPISHSFLPKMKQDQLIKIFK